jgi:hypothetical protein
MKKGASLVPVQAAAVLNDRSNRNRTPWFDPILSYSPAVHRTKQALFHCAVVSDINTNPLPPPHPELLKYFEPPKRVIKRAQASVEECMHAFKVKEGVHYTAAAFRSHFTVVVQFPRRSRSSAKTGTSERKTTTTTCSCLTR